MALVTPVVNVFIQTEARPMAERLRSLRYQIDSMLNEWDNGVSADVPNNATLLEDGREAQGVQTVNGAQMHALIAFLRDDIKPILESAGAQTVLAKLSVRSLEATL